MKIIPLRGEPYDATPIRKGCLEEAAWICKHHGCILEVHINSDMAFLKAKVNGKFATVIDFTISNEDWVVFDLSDHPQKFSNAFMEVNYTLCDGSPIY